MTTEAPAAAPAPGATAAPATPSAPAAAPSGYDWTSAGLDADTLGYVQNKGWKGPGDSVQSYRNLEKLTGVPADKLIKLPKDDNAEDWNQVYSKLGRPESPDKYDIPLPEGDSGEFAKAARTWFHEAGLSASQARKVAEKWNAHVGEASKAEQAKIEQAHSADVAALKATWGDKYNTNAVLVDRAAEAFGMTEQQLAALKQTMGPAAAMKFLHNIGSKMGVEDSGLVRGDTKSPGFGVSPEQALAKINEYRRDRSFVERFNSPDPKTRGEARSEMERLHRIAYPDA